MRVRGFEILDDRYRNHVMYILDYVRSTPRRVFKHAVNVAKPHVVRYGNDNILLVPHGRKISIVLLSNPPIKIGILHL